MRNFGTQAISGRQKPKFSTKTKSRKPKTDYWILAFAIVAGLLILAGMTHRIIEEIDEQAELRKNPIKLKQVTSIPEGPRLERGFQKPNEDQE